MPNAPDLRLSPGDPDRLFAGSNFGSPGAVLLEDGTRAIFDGRSVYLAGPGDTQVGPAIPLTDLMAGTSREAEFISIAALEGQPGAGGGFVVAVAHPTDLAKGRVQVVNADGTPRGPAFDLQSIPLDVVALPGGGFAVLRQTSERHSADPYDVTLTLQLQRHDAGGAAQGAPVAVTEGRWPHHATAVTAEALDDGRIAVAWHREPDALQVAIVDGAAASAPVRFGTAGERTDLQERPLIVERADGGLAMVWADESSSLLVRLLGADGTPEGNPVLVVGQMGFSATFDAIEAADGNFLIAYKEVQANGLKLAMLAPDGQPMAVGQTLATGLAGSRVEALVEGPAGPSVILEGGRSVDQVDLGYMPFTTLGAGGDLVQMGPASGPVDTGPGDDTIRGGSGNDTVIGGAGDDIADFGRDSFLFVFGETGSNRMDGGAGDDRLVGGANGDLLIGGTGRDTVNGGNGDDTLFGGGQGDADEGDVILGGHGNDIAHGGAGNDQIFGMWDNDTLNGDAGADTLAGQVGDDVLSGGAGADLLFGNDGDDLLRGGGGQDRLHGGAGADRFLSLGPAADAPDWIADYAAAEGDVLAFAGPATRADFQVNIAATPGAGLPGVDEAFVVHRPTGAIVWALVDGAGQDAITLQIGGQVFDLLA